MLPAMDMPGRGRTRRAARTACAIVCPSSAACSSHSHAPSRKDGSCSAAACSARRVLPTPPTPTTVTSDDRCIAVASSASSSARPTNELGWIGRFPANASSERPRAAASNTARCGPARLSASASSRAVSLRAVRLIPRSRSLTDRGERLAALASSSCVSPASARSCRSSPPKPGAACSAMGLIVPSPAPARRPHPAQQGRRGHRSHPSLQTRCQHGYSQE